MDRIIISFLETIVVNIKFYRYNFQIDRSIFDWRGSGCLEVRVRIRILRYDARAWIEIIAICHRPSIEKIKWRIWRISKNKLCIKHKQASEYCLIVSFSSMPQCPCNQETQNFRNKTWERWFPLQICWSLLEAIISNEVLARTNKELKIRKFDRWKEIRVSSRSMKEFSFFNKKEYDSVTQRLVRGSVQERDFWSMLTVKMFKCSFSKLTK